MSEVLVPESTLNMDVVKFNVTDSEIAKMKEEYMGLTINGIEDKAGYDLVYKARQAVKKTRVSLVKHADEMKEKALAWQRKVNTEKNRVVGELETIEAHLQSEEDKIEAERQRIEEEKEKAKRKRIQDRVDALQKYGSEIELAYLEGLNDEGFEVVLGRAKIEFDKEQERKAEEKKEKEKERLRLEAERKELEELRKQQAEAQRIIDENNRKQVEEHEKIEEEKKLLQRKKIENRHQMIESLGMTKGWNHFVYGKFQWKIEAIDNYSDVEFKIEFEETRKAIASLKNEEQKKREAEIEQAVKAAKEKALKEKEEQDRIKKEQEAERIAQATDATKFQVVVDNLQSTLLHFPSMKTKKSQRLAEDIKSRIKGMVADIETSIVSKTQKVS